MYTRLFLNSRAVIPFVLYTSYTKKEVEETIVSFKRSGLIESIEPIFLSEKRYNIADKSLRGLTRVMWLVRMLDYELLIRRLLHSRPTDLDRRYLAIYIGDSLADRMIANAYHTRRSYKEERQIEERAIRELGERRRRSSLYNYQI